jgi:hypothetical protein
MDESVRKFSSFSGKGRDAVAELPVLIAGDSEGKEALDI